MAHKLEDRDGGPAKAMLADLTGENPELIEGYLIVAVRIDGRMVIGHNACCTSHMIAEVIRYMKANPDINKLNPALPNAHDQ